MVHASEQRQESSLGSYEAWPITRRDTLAGLSGFAALLYAENASAVSFAEKKAAAEARKAALLKRRSAKLQGKNLAPSV